MKRSPEKKEEKVTEQEVLILRTLVQSLRERERSLEIQLLEYYGLKEQESTVLDLENRLKISAMEAELLSLKIESLQAENRRLEAQVSDYSRTKAVLEVARTKIKHLKRKMKSESAQAKEKITALHQRVAAVQDLECRWEKEEEESERTMKMLKDLENEVVELRRANSNLEMVNSDLANKLESSRKSKSPEATKEQEESNCLRQKNDLLTKQVEQLQTDRCADVEELVYLRWVNACLRFELRNFQPPPGKTAARDLSTTFSPRSEHKVKQLILEYANSGADEKNINLVDFDSECCSSSQASNFGELDDASTDASTVTKNSSSTKTKFFTKLKRLVLAKDMKDSRASSVDRCPMSCGNSSRRASVSDCSFDEIVGRDSYDGAASCITLENAQGGDHLVIARAKADEKQQNGSLWTQNLSRVSLDFRRLRSHDELGECHKSDAEASWPLSTAMGEELLLASPHSARLEKETMESVGNLEPWKHAHASKRPRGKPRLRARSASFAFF